VALCTIALTITLIYLKLQYLHDIDQSQVKLNTAELFYFEVEKSDDLF